MRGFVITIVSVSLIILLIALSMSLRNAYLGIERVLAEPLPLTYAAFILDDVACELSVLVGPQMSFNERNNSLGVTVTDTLHAYNHFADIRAYEAFLEGEVAGRTRSSISANFSNMSDASNMTAEVKVLINGKYRYTNNHAGSEAFFTRDGGTNATSYEINFTVGGIRTNVTNMAFNSSGTMNVTIRYTDYSGTGIESGKVFPDVPNAFRVDYENGSVIVTVGLGSGNKGSLRMEAEGVEANTTWTAMLPRLDAGSKRGYEYDASISYVQGRVAKNCRIGK